jgi:hypothetical protein
MINTGLSPHVRPCFVLLLICSHGQCVFLLYIIQCEIACHYCIVDVNYDRLFCAVVVLVKYSITCFFSFEGRKMWMISLGIPFPFYRRTHMKSVFLPSLGFTMTDLHASLVLLKAIDHSHVVVFDVLTSKRTTTCLDQQNKSIQFDRQHTNFPNGCYFQLVDFEAECIDREVVLYEGEKTQEK